MREKIQEDISHSWYQEKFTNDGQRFIAWYLRNIHKLDPNQAKDCITDGPNDKQIDAVYVDSQESTIYIIQGKFYGAEEIGTGQLSEIATAWMQFKDLRDLQEKANPKLAVKINEIRKALEEDYGLCFEFVTTSKLSPQADADFEVFRKFIADNEELDAQLSVIDGETLRSKYDQSLCETNSRIDHIFTVDKDKRLAMKLNGINTVLAAVPLKECVNVPGIKDGKLFKKNVRQALGKNNKVNKGIARTIKNAASDFFFCHNGITVICSSVFVDGTKLVVKNMNVVNGCQSLTTIYGCGEAAKSSGGYILFKFYEISDNAKADGITNSTNSQSAVKARDLRSTDKIVLAMKRTYEQAYPDGQLITKRGEEAGSECTAKHILELTLLGKTLIAWHSQRPNLSYGETKIFDSYFRQLFHKNYKAEDMQALKDMFDAVMEIWEDPGNGLNETLLAMKAYAPYHILYAVSALANEFNKKTGPQGGKVPSPSKVYAGLFKGGMLKDAFSLAAQVLNAAFEAASDASAEQGKLFVPANWIKNKGSVLAINSTVKSHVGALKILPGGKEQVAKLSACLSLTDTDYSDRYSAD